MLDNCTSLIDTAKRLCAMPEDTVEDLSVPLVDVNVVAICSGVVLSRDGNNTLKDSLDKNEAAFKNSLKAFSLAIGALRMLPNFIRAIVVGADELM